MITAETISHVQSVIARHANAQLEESDYPFEGRSEDFKHRYWDMVRELKNDSNMVSLPGHLAIPVLRQVVGDLTALGYETEDDASDDLESIWDKVKLAAREAPLSAAARMADQCPIKFQTARLSIVYQRLLNIGYQLQVMRGNDYISLPVVRLGEILRVNPRRVSDYRTFAQHDGFLHEVAKSCYSASGGVATKFRFACSVVDGLASPSRSQQS
jgi:hypothetical protein